MEAAWHVLNPKQPLMLSSMPCDMPPTMLQLACIQRLHARPVHRTTVPPVTWQRAIMPSMRIADALDGNKAACGRGFWRAGLLLKVLTHQGSAIDVSPVPCRAQSSMPNTMNFTWFLALLGAGLLFSVLAFSLFLPIIILAPSKFAICFTTGSALIMSAFVSLRGWRGQLAHMFSAERLPFTVGELRRVDVLQNVMHSMQWPVFDCERCHFALITHDKACDHATSDILLQDTWEAWGALCMLRWACTATS